MSIRPGLIVFVFGALSAWGIQWAATGVFAQQREPQGPVQSSKPATDARRAKLAAAKQAYEMLVDLEKRGLADGRSAVEERCTWSRRWMEAERDAAADDAARRQAVVAHRDRMKPLLAMMERRQQAGMLSGQDLAATRYFVAEAEQWAAEAGGQ